MHPSAVFASAVSRLHADLIVIRLKRAGISPDRISAVFPENQQPNCALCWLDGHSTANREAGEAFTVAGPLHRLLSSHSASSLTKTFQSIGLSSDHAATCVESLAKGQILIAVQTEDEEQIAIGWHILRDLHAEGIFIATKPAKAPVVRASNWFKGTVTSHRKERGTLAFPGLTLATA
jgi:hypothetical protein